jgi:dinuclear metal center YbgI/SA1388 family protein
MNEVSLAQIVSHFDLLLRVGSTPDYPLALNGLQVEHRGPVRKIAAAVDCSQRTIRGAIEVGANLLVVHHGLFWGGLQPLTGSFYSRVRLMLEHDLALYAAHLPLDAHETLGNSKLLAHALDLLPTAGFGRYEGLLCGVRGTCAEKTAGLYARVRAFSQAHGGDAICSSMSPGRTSQSWAICSGAGANHGTIQEAVELGIDTLIVGEGPHWSAVDADEKGLVIIYAGHYATETLGVQSLASKASELFGIPWAFVAAPTGL